MYSEVPNKHVTFFPASLAWACWEKFNTLIRNFRVSKLINEQGGIFCLLHEKLQAGWKVNLKKFKRACSSIRDFRVYVRN